MSQKTLQTRNRYNQRAFTRISGGSGSGVSYGDARGRADALPLVFDAITGEIIEPLFYLSYLEDAIRDLAEGGYLKALRGALKEYRKLWLELAKGGRCK